MNVFELGKVVSFFSRKLYITLPPTDPCLYVMRFAAALKFGDKENEVIYWGYCSVENYSG